MSAKKPLLWSPPQPAAVHREWAKKPVEWVIDHHINAGGYGFLLGRRGSYKTGLALHIAIGTVLGRPPLGDDWFGIGKSGRVVYMDGHENNQLLYPRIERVLNGFDATDEERDKVWRELYTYHGTDINFFTGNNCDEFLEWSRGVQPVLTIFDTFQRFYAGGGYTDADTARAIVRDAELRYETGTTTLYPHHPPKNKEAADPFRGGSGFLDAADFAFKLTRSKGSRVLNVTCEKFRPGPEPEPFRLSVHEESPVDPMEDSGILQIRYAPPAGQASDRRALTIQRQIRDFVRANLGTSKNGILNAVKARREDVSAEVDNMVAAKPPELERRVISRGDREEHEYHLPGQRSGP